MGLQRLMLMQIILFGPILAATAATAITQALPGCQDQERCGDVNISYPFGTREGCYHNELLRIDCNETSRGLKAYIAKTSFTVTKISLNGQLHILNRIARACYNESGGLVIRPRYNDKLRLPSKSYAISNTQNKFTVVGCDSFGTVHDLYDRFITGCTSRCGSVDYVPSGTCSGVGCCQTSIPEGLNYSSLIASSFYNHTYIRNFNNCSFAFIVETDAFNFSSNNLTNLEKIQRLPMVIDWTIGSETCEVAKRNWTSYACKDQKSECFPTPGIDYGYRCKCLEGYDGNPYIGCQDINECNNATLSQCVRTATCINIPGNYKCSCPKGRRGDGRKDSEGCSPDQSRVIKIVASVAAAVIALLVCSSWLYLRFKKKKLELKAKFFAQNGGLKLGETLSKRGGATETIKIFKSEELEKATTNYARGTMIGRGGFGTVYRGNLENGRTVAIKKSKLVDQSLIDQYIKEVVVLSQINHKNVVKLLGCCLETEVPLLVYEFITNGTLFKHIHDESSKPSIIPWTDRLRIAAETAGALSYLHSGASDSIIHGDVKSANILLDANYIAKVTDFGSSRFVAPELDQLSTMVQGTRGYLDPEYLQTNHLTTKSDVYSFGVVLVELLTGMKAYSPDKPEKERYLAMYFLSSLEEDRLFDIIDRGIDTEQQQQQLLKEVANLAKRCLSVKGEERPTMTEVLEGLRMTGRVASRD